MSTIKERLNKIKLITNGKIKISQKKIKYPLKVSKKNLSETPLLDSNNIPEDFFEYLFKHNQIVSLFDKKGTYGLPFKACQKDCKKANNQYFSIKIMFFSKIKNELKFKTITDLKRIVKYLNKYYKANTQSKKNIIIKNSDNLDSHILQKNKLKINEDNINLYCQIDKYLSQNIELRIIYLLRKLVTDKKTPHINLPIISFRFFLSKLLGKINIKNYFYDPTITYDITNVLLSEWCYFGDLKSFLEKMIDSQVFNTSNLIYWRVLFFQILQVLMVININHPNFRHNDLHLKNFLVDKVEDKGFYLYKIKFPHHKDYSNYLVPNKGFQIRLWDFDYSTNGKELTNRKLMVYDSNTNDYHNYSDISNKYSDMFYVFYKIYCRFYSKIEDENKVLKNFFNDILYKNQKVIKFFKEYNTQTCQDKRIYGINIKNTLEYDTPMHILSLHSFDLENGLFKEFLIKKEDIKKYNIIETYTTN